MRRADLEMLRAAAHRLRRVNEAHIMIALAHDQVTRHEPQRAHAVHAALIDAIQTRHRITVSIAGCGPLPIGRSTSPAPDVSGDW